MVDYQQMGYRIRTRRHFLGKTQKEIAEAINVAPSYYSNIERGIRVPSIDTLVAIANYLDVGVDYLLFDSLVSAMPRRSYKELRVIQRYLREEIDKFDYSSAVPPDPEKDKIRLD